MARQTRNNTQRKTRPQGSFNLDQFAKTIQAKGLIFRWSRGITCSCRLNSETDQPNPTCTRCGGDGWSYVNPFHYRDRDLDRDYTEIPAILSQMGINPTLTEVIGEYFFTGAMAQMTVEAEYVISYRDRLVATTQKMAFTEGLYRLAGDPVPVGRRNRTTAQKLGSMRYEPLEILFVESDSSGTQVIYYPGTDFRLVSPKTPTAGQYVPGYLEWLPGRGPAEGEWYVISYLMRPVWIVSDATYRIQHSVGPAKGLKGTDVVQDLPTTFKVQLDWYGTPT